MVLKMCSFCHLPNLWLKWVSCHLLVRIRAGVTGLRRSVKPLTKIVCSLTDRRNTTKSMIQSARINLIWEKGKVLKERITRIWAFLYTHVYTTHWQPLLTGPSVKTTIPPVSLYMTSRGKPSPRTMKLSLMRLIAARRMKEANKLRWIVFLEQWSFLEMRHIESKANTIVASNWQLYVFLCVIFRHNRRHVTSDVYHYSGHIVFV